MGGKGRGFFAHSQNSGGVVGRPLPTKMGSRFPSFIPGHQRLSCLYQVIDVFLVYTRSSTSSCLYQVINVLLFIPGHQRLLVYTRSSASSCLYQVITILFITGHQRLLVYTRSSTSSCLYQVINILLFIPGHQRLVYTRSSPSSCLYQVINVLFIPGHHRLLVYTRSSSDSSFITGEASYSHQWPGCGERFLGQYNADERFLGRLREWHLGECDPRLWEGSGW